MKVSIIPVAINLNGADLVPKPSTATIIVSFDVVSDLGRLTLNSQVIPEEDASVDLNEALRIAVKSLADFGRSLAEEAEKEAPLTICSPASF